jgi:phosphoserine phosphatase RsbX
VLPKPTIDVELASAPRPAVGESVCGDAFVSVEHGPLLFIALADGLGHGPKAAEPALLFCKLIMEATPREPIELVQIAMQGLKDTRGAVGAVLRINRVTQSLVFSGIGNIALRTRSREPIAPVCSPGILGRKGPRLSTFSYKVHPEDVIVFHTDGVSERYEEKLLLEGDSQQLAELLLREHGRSHDDATCLVLRVSAASR